MTRLETAVFLALHRTLDLDALYRIKQEGLNASKVMETTSFLADIYGPRLTGSPNIKLPRVPAGGRGRGQQ